MLIVDDEDTNRELLGALFAHRCQLVVAATGQAAIAAVQERVPDLVLLDIGLPDLDGYEVCRRLKSVPGANDLPVIFISGHTAYRDKVQSFEAGAVDFVEKPFHPEEVRVRVETHLSLHRRRRGDAARAEALELLLEDREALLEERRRLTAMIVHDIGSPLLVVSHFIQRLKAGGTPTEVDLDAASSSIDSAREMVDQALVLTRLGSAQLPVNTELHNLGDVIRGALAMARGSVEHPAGIEGLNLWCDRSLIERVVANLVNNAQDHGEPPIRLDVVSTSSELRIEVSDGGPGVAQSRTQRVFDDYSTTGELARGIGLTFCRRAVEAHGGHIAVEGARFSVHLPLG